MIRSTRRRTWAEWSRTSIREIESTINQHPRFSTSPLGLPDHQRHSFHPELPSTSNAVDRPGSSSSAAKPELNDPVDTWQRFVDHAQAG